MRDDFHCWISNTPLVRQGVKMCVLESPECLERGWRTSMGNAHAQSASFKSNLQLKSSEEIKGLREI